MRRQKFHLFFFGRAKDVQVEETETTATNVMQEAEIEKKHALHL